MQKKTAVMPFVYLFILYKPLGILVSMETCVGGGSGDSGETFYPFRFCCTDEPALFHS